MAAADIGRPRWWIRLRRRGALGASLVAMVAGLSTGRPKTRSTRRPPSLPRARTRPPGRSSCGSAGCGLGRLPGFAAAMKMPRETTGAAVGPGAPRSSAAARGASEVPWDCVRACSALAPPQRLSGGRATSTPPSDLLRGLDAAETGPAARPENVRVNLPPRGTSVQRTDAPRPRRGPPRYRLARRPYPRDHLSAGPAIRRSVRAVRKPAAAPAPPPCWNVLLTRHGYTTVARPSWGASSTSPSPRGSRRGAALGRRLAPGGSIARRSSPMIRALETARNHCPGPSGRDRRSGIREMNYGTGRGWRPSQPQGGPGAARPLGRVTRPRPHPRRRVGRGGGCPSPLGSC